MKAKIDNSAWLSVYLAAMPVNKAEKPYQKTYHFPLTANIELTMDIRNAQEGQVIRLDAQNHGFLTYSPSSEKDFSTAINIIEGQDHFFDGQPCL